MVIDKEAELRRLRRHLSVQGHAERAAKTKLDRLRKRGAPAAWIGRAERVYAEAAAGRDRFERMVAELEGTP